MTLNDGTRLKRNLTRRCHMLFCELSPLRSKAHHYHRTTKRARVGAKEWAVSGTRGESFTGAGTSEGYLLRVFRKGKKSSKMEKTL